MTINDFIFLNVPGLLSRYGVSDDGYPDGGRRALIFTYTNTQIEFFRNEGLLLPNSEVMTVPIEEAVVKYSDFTDEGQKFIMTSATDKWLSSCDKKGDLASYQDPSGLIKRLNKFRAR